MDVPLAPGARTDVGTEPSDAGSMEERTGFIWMDGALTPWKDARAQSRSRHPSGS
jgi:hypothetical protein